jgi:hypothetical protein
MRLGLMTAAAALCFCLCAQAQMIADAALPSAPAASAVTDPAPVLPPSDLSALPLLSAPAAVSLAVRPVPEPAKRKIVDKKFIFVNAMVLALTTADIELTQHCLAAKTCVELNPTLPRSRWGMYAVNTVTNTAVTYFSYRRRKSGKWGWWVAPVVDIGAHAVGVGSNFRFVF